MFSVHECYQVRNNSLILKMLFIKFKMESAAIVEITGLLLFGQSDSHHIRQHSATFDLGGLDVNNILYSRIS